jgi:small subunit ribosomal protein S11
MKKQGVKNKKKKLKSVAEGVAYIYSTFNNTIVTITENDGSVLCWKSSGTSGFKGTKKGTPFAAQVAAEKAAQSAVEHNMKKLSVKVKGIGPGREPAIRSIQSMGIEITSIHDVTPIPHNGTRPRKSRRP